MRKSEGYFYMKLDENFLYIPYSKQLNYKLNGHWSAKHNAWRFNKSIHVLNEIEKTIPNIAQTDVFKQIRQQLEHSLAIRTKLKNQEPQPHTQLRPYQVQDINFLKHLQHAAILNEPRTGKSPTIISLMKLKSFKRIIIVCPASLQLNWLHEIKKWHPEATTTMDKKKLQTFEGYFIMSKNAIKDFTNSDAIIVDEAHFLRNRDTKQSKAIHQLGKLAKHRYVLTGTPTVKHPADIFGILTFLYPDKFSSYWGFINRYFKTYKGFFGVEIGEPIKHRQAELLDLIDAISTQRLRKDVMQWLPDKQRIEHHIQLNSKQQKIYDQMKNDFIAEYDDQLIDTPNILSQLMRLRQITLEPSLLGFDIPSAKTDAILEAIENNTYTEKGEPIVIMSAFTSYLNKLKPLLEKSGRKVEMITGQMTTAQKQQSAENFQCGTTDTLLCNIKSAGTGFTLDRAEVIFFLDKEWNPSDNEQAEDRITPTTENNRHAHTIVSFICENTVESKMEQLLKTKKDLTSVINQSKPMDFFRLLL